MSNIQLGTNEFERILELSELNLDYTDLQKYLVDLTNLAALTANTDISLVNLIDSFTQWSVSRSGIELEQMPREDSVCQYTILNDHGLEVNDLSLDHRFSDKFYVVDKPNLKYYYGIPLKTKDGNNIGALCVLDSESKSLDPEKKELLKLIANEIVTRLLFLKENNNLRIELEEAKGANLKTIHDIRGPLSGIIGVADLVEQKLDPEQAKKVLELVVLIKKSGQSLMELANELLDHTRVQNVPKDDEYDCDGFIKKMGHLYEPQAKSKNINLKFTSTGDQIIFPKTKLTQIAGNLISNAIKFTPEFGEVHVEIGLEVRDERLSFLNICVSDSGPGVSQEIIENITSGNQESTEGTKGETGYGFGMKLVKYLVDKAKGEIVIQSELGKGTKIKVSIPH